MDVVHAANPPDTLCLVGAVFRLLGKRFVFDQHDLAPELYLSRFARRGSSAVVAALRLLERCSYAVANVVIATNDSYRRRAIEIGRLPEDKVFVVRNGPPLVLSARSSPIRHWSNARVSSSATSAPSVRRTVSTSGCARCATWSSIWAGARCWPS